MNRLADETSPYLRQHAGNPVDWFPWGDEAFEVARRRDRPVFLSIGYSACHWCHVMAHESFEDQPTARMLNDRFVSVKVDREERPDVDQVYMEAVQTITGAGGWPMSVFLTPDRRPFYGGTYFPPDDRRGFASFRTVLDALTDAWDHRRDEVEQQADELCRSMAARSMVPARPRTDSGLGPQPAAGEELALLDVAAADLAARFDPEWGGFGRAPKFPQPGLVDLALRHALRHRGDPDGDRSQRMALLTLDAMAAGGIHDHLGGGFARYSTDDQWLVPHFEKMLYDQASLLPAYLHGWQVAKREDYLVVMNGIVGYVERDLTAPEGGVYSAEDADSDGGEGRFYVWSPEGVSRAVDEGRAGDRARAEAVAEFFGVREGGNWEGRSILRRPPGAALVGDAAVEAGRRRLLAARALRPRPALDDKVLTEWNAMYASALAEAAAATGNRAWAAQAVRIGEFLLDRLRGDDGRWRRSWQREGGARHLAYAGDYAWLVDCFTRLGELTGEAAWTGHARVTADALVSLFLDEDDGGFFTTGHDAETLIVRTKDLFDGATPSANAVAAQALARLGAITGEERYRARALGVVDMFGPLLSEHPAAFAQTALTADALGTGLIEVVVTGHRPDLVDVVHGRWLPGGVLAWGEPTASPLWQDREEGRAYVCRQYACRLPADDPAALSAQLDEALAGGLGMSKHTTRSPRQGTARDLARAIKPRALIEVAGGTALTVLVLACHGEDTIGVDLASGTLVRVRVDWPEDHTPDLSPFDVVETRLAEEPERDDLAQPEAVTSDGLPRHLGTLHGRRVRRLLHRLAAPVEEHILGFPGASAPYWEFRGFRPSLALVVPSKGPVLFRRLADRTVWARFGWGRSDNWLPVEDPRAERALSVARRDRLAGKDLATALGAKPHYVLAAVTTPRDGHCYKTVRGLLPRS